MGNRFFETFEHETAYSEEIVATYHKRGYWCDMAVSDYLDLHASEQGDNLAVIDDTASITWAELRERADEVAAGICDLGIEEGTPIAFQLPNCIDWFTFRYGISRSGCIAVPIYPRFGSREIEYVLETIEPAMYIGEHADEGEFDRNRLDELTQSIDSLDHVFFRHSNEATSFDALLGDPSDFSPRRIDPDYPDVLALSSGTTGMPKIYYIVQNSYLNTGRDLTGRFSLSGFDTLGSFAPVQQALGHIIAVYMPLASGATVSVTNSTDPAENWERITRDKPTFILALPTITTKLMNAQVADQYSLESVRALVNGGGPLPTDVAYAAEEKGATVVNAYGAGDAAWATTARPLDRRQTRIETVGPPNQSIGIRVIDDTGNQVPQGEIGEVLIGGGACGFGYFHDQERTKEVFDIGGEWEGWFHSNDAGFLDSMGNLTIVGRMDDMIIRGGQNIYPAEIEDVLLEHDDIIEAAVLGVPDAELGERVGAVIVEAPEASVSLDEVIDWFASKELSKFKWPERLETRDSLPKSPGGKIMKSELEASFSADME